MNKKTEKIKTNNKELEKSSKPIVKAPPKKKNKKR